MKQIKKLFVIFMSSVSFIFSGCGNYFNTIPNNTSNNKITNFNENLIIRFKSSVSKNEILKLNKSLGTNSFKFISGTLNMGEIKVNTQNDLNRLKEAYNKSNLTEYVETDGKLSIFPFEVYPANSNNFSIKAGEAKPNDTFYGLQWNAPLIEANKAWVLTTGSHNITVAVIDSGVDPNHPDLKDNLLPLIDIWNESGETDIYTYGSIENNYGGKDGNGHGTHVTGIIGAIINNSRGVAGIAGNVMILPIKAANFEGNTSASVITKSIIRAVDKGVQVINLSIGGPKSEGTQALKDAVNLALSKGIVFVSATGNESNRAGNFIEQVTVPAAYPGVIAVSAVTKYKKVANYSNGGPETEIAAPGGGAKSGEGEKIYSTWPTYKTFEGYHAGITGPYALLSGTSMACPHVSAVAALILNKEPNLTGQQVRVRILSTVEDIESKGFDYSTGFGLLNAYKALVSDSHDKVVK